MIKNVMSFRFFVIQVVQICFYLIYDYNFNVVNYDIEIVN